MLDLNLLTQVEVIKYLIMISVFYGVVRLTKYLMIRK